MLSQFEHDRKADAVYIRLSNKPYAYTKRIDDLRYVDYTSDGTPIGIELLCVSEGVIVNDLPNLDEVTRLLEGKNIRVFA